jgi:hypothetical protein
MPTGIDSFKSFILKLEDNDLIAPALSNVILGQIDSGGIASHRNSAPNGVIYDWKTNRIYYDEIVFANVVSSLYTKFKNAIDIHIKLKDEKAVLERMMTEDMGRLLATLLYSGIHAYNKNQRGALTEYDSNRRFYGGFFYRSVYEVSDNLTTLGRKVAALWYRKYIQLILEMFEIPSYHGQTISDKQLKNFKFALTEIKDDIYNRLEYYNFDQPSLDSFSKWFGIFMKEFDICAQNQDHRIVNFNQKLLDSHDFEALTFSCLQNAYDRISPVNTAELRYPVPIFRELFITAEPMAQYIYSLSLSKKLKADNEIQYICARGMSFLN